MDTVRSIEGQAVDYSVTDEPRMEPPPSIGGDERRMQVRAYNYWVSLLGGRAYPSIEDLDPASIVDFGPHSVLLDFSRDAENPAIAYLGSALREEGGYDDLPRQVREVPSGSLLSRLTDHYLQIIANHAPIGFEAEFVNRFGQQAMYRGILMPFSSSGGMIDFIYGVINWKVAVDDYQAGELVLEIGQALATSPAAIPVAPVWADGPSAWNDDEPEETEGERALTETLPGEEAGLADHLAAARATAEMAIGARVRSRAALYRALGLAYDFALAADAAPDDYAELLDDSGLKAQARAPMTPIVKLVFGPDYDKTRLTEFATVLAHGQRIGLPRRALTDYLDTAEGGIKGIVAAERAARRPAQEPQVDPRVALRAAPARAVVDIGPVEDEFLLVVARREPDGRVSLIAPLPGGPKMIERALRKVVR